eukprot:CAMPEP_0184307492 /NCGR_PEP_ID=MMETSP1049-20130417/16233_1 /TAXON_ID=77928 /ORGANISM="Proteomonas sulcata, Strain CCMP704" /LENGTH=42 /DNA_ID= /DNA_START= /DNA_END= /DNA_ORIENTATION=
MPVVEEVGASRDISNKAESTELEHEGLSKGERAELADKGLRA